jgi:hypothetical protein
MNIERNLRWYTIIFTKEVRAKQGNVVPVHAMRAYIVRLSPMYFNLRARWMWSTS